MCVLSMQVTNLSRGCLGALIPHCKVKPRETGSAMAAMAEGSNTAAACCGKSLQRIHEGRYVRLYKVFYAPVSNLTLEYLDTGI